MPSEARHNQAARKENWQIDFSCFVRTSTGWQELMTTLSSATIHFSNCSYNNALSRSIPIGLSNSRLEFPKLPSSFSHKSLSCCNGYGARQCGHGRRKSLPPYASSEGPGSLSSKDEEVSLPSISAVDLKSVEEPGSGRDVEAEEFSLLQTRRFWLGTSVAALVALGGNLGGVTCAILDTNPEFSRNVRADLLFPVKGFKRCLETSQGFEFVYPESWVGDQRLVYRAVERAERDRALDLPPIRGERRPQRRSADPIVAFGPPGTEGEMNVSVVVAPVYPGFSLQKLGGPREAGELILKKFIAPEGSNKVATLLTAQQRFETSNLYYTLEFTVKSATFFRHNLSVYSTRNNLLFSLNAQTPEKNWERVQDDFVQIANSFKLISA